MLLFLFLLFFLQMTSSIKTLKKSRAQKSVEKQKKYHLTISYGIPETVFLFI